MKGTTNSNGMGESNIVHKTGDETIDGTKTFVDPVRIASLTAGDTATGYITKQSDTNNEYLRTGTNRMGTSDFAELRIGFNKSTGKAFVYLVKTVSGVTSQTLIGEI